MIQRTAEKYLKKLALQFKIVAVVGPRQSGKTTLVRKLFQNKTYVNFENPDTRLFAMDDPRGFLSNYPQGAIFDEVQRVPEIFSYLQQIVDENTEKGQFVLTGSNNFLLQENISQSLAGRVGYLNLLPLSMDEINKRDWTINQLLFTGGYPALYQEPVDTSIWYANYIKTYVERDVRLIKNISNLVSFERFIRLCAGRVGQLLNMNSLATEVGVDVKTIKAWIGVLETSFIAFRLQPYFKNYKKRIVKMPKLYFYDTGLASALLGIESPKQMDLHYLRGELFENLIVIEFLKNRYNAAKRNNLYFWRDSLGHEIDLLLDNDKLVPIEIKSGQTVNSSFFKGINYWSKITKTIGGYLVYGGDMNQKRSNDIEIISYKNLSRIFKQYE